MNSEIWRRLTDKHMNLAGRLGDRMFVLSIYCIIIPTHLIPPIIMACLCTIAPAIVFFLILYDVTVLPPGVKAFIGVFLTLGSCCLLTCILGPVYSRIMERLASLDVAIDAWLQREHLSWTYLKNNDLSP